LRLRVLERRSEKREVASRLEALLIRVKWKISAGAAMSELARLDQRCAR
jgi:hypothetical protein